MNKIILLFVCLISFQSINAQKLDECKKAVDFTFKIIENPTKEGMEMLKLFYSKDFAFAGQKGGVARSAFAQVFFKNKILSKAKSQVSLPNTTNELNYTIIYEKLGTKEVSFVFNTENKIKEIKIEGMEVKTVLEKPELIKSTKNFINIPFKRAGNLIIVSVDLNGQKKDFLLDTGAPQVILNSKHFKDNVNSQASGVKGAGGNVSNIGSMKIENINFGGIQMNDTELLTMDLSHLEDNFKMKVHGLIGFSMIKDYDLLFKYEENILTLIQPSYFEIYRKDNLLNNEFKRVSFELTTHIPVVDVVINNTTYALGIDSGAEANLIDVKHFEVLKKHLKKRHADKLSGADKNVQKVEKGEIKRFYIGSKKYKKLNTIFSDISHLNEGYNLNIDGLLGYEILSKQKTLLSYKRRELVFFN
ncbi:retroviral-like aspartic protease family protein [Ichthyenterobacterium magnum]|uniref:Aspartyl protease n=1 Tax=Ichthyenterobacterium magnum TaxID=1230530 RepID=A0A420DKT7_9FLAO|nr:retroviral-like aspartic protease family protein [Ichthyenterobacterium magnum]RKE94805.1 aspartyl protease [Ichthyenterobacterium magnum]